MIDIIIPAYNNSDLTLACLQSIYLYTKNYRILFIDNGSDPEHMLPVMEELTRHRNFVWISNPENAGFIKAVNQGLTLSLKLSAAPRIVILNNDVQVTFHWIEKLSEPINKNLTVAAVGPLTTSPDCWQGRREYKPGSEILKKGTMLAFFCVMLKRVMVEHVGLLDERFGLGFGDDDDYCHRIQQAGYDLALVNDLIIPHRHRSTFRIFYSDDKIKELEEMGRKTFKTKHGLK